jgi:hypothetical protein
VKRLSDATAPQPARSRKSKQRRDADNYGRRDEYGAEPQDDGPTRDDASRGPDTAP